MKRQLVTPLSRAAALLLAASLIGGCAVGAEDGAGNGEEKAVAYPTKGISVLAPGGAGGGWDTRARGMSQALTQCKVISEQVTVTIDGRTAEVPKGHLHDFFFCYATLQEQRDRLGYGPTVFAEQPLP